MASWVLDGFTPSQEQLRNISEAIVQEVFVHSPIEDTNDILTGYSHDQQIILAEAFSVVGKAFTDCVPADVGGMTLTEKTAQPKLMGGRLTYCVNSENQNLVFMKQAKCVFDGYFKRNPHTSELNLIFSQLALAIHNSIRPKAWFSDTAAALSTGGGVFSPGTDLGLFNQIDGLWKKVFALGATHQFAITKNAGANYAAQALAAGDGLAIVKGLYAGMGTMLGANPNAKIMVTNTIYKQLLMDLGDKGLDSSCCQNIFLDGINKITIYGMEIIAVPDWDITINAFQNDGTKWNLPHRGVVTTTSNVPIYTLCKTDLERLEYIYDAVGKKNLLDFGYFLGTDLLVDELLFAAY